MGLEFRTAKPFMLTRSHLLTFRATRWILLLVIMICLTGCATTPEQPKQPAPTIPVSGLPIPDTVTTVLPDGSTVMAHTAAGWIKIEAGPGSLRVFTWESARRGVAAKPRAKPFPGADSLGLHYNGKPPIWKPYEGIDKLHYEESTRNFQALVDLKIWTQIRRLYFAYNDQGLAVGWKRDGDTLHVEVWQFYVDGQKPEQVPGANNDAIIFKAPGQTVDGNNP